MKKRKIIIVAKCYESNESGPANIVRGLVKELKKENVPFEAVLLKEDVTKIGFIKELISALKKSDEALVNVHTEGFLIPLLIYFLSFLFNKHLYYLTVHGIYKIDSSMNLMRQDKYIYIEEFLYQHFPNLICVSEMQKNSIESIFGRNNNVYVIPNGTDAESNAEYVAREPVEMISLGGLKRIKGIYEIIEMATIIKNKNLNWHISIYGSADSNEEWFEEKIRENSLHTIIEYKGLLNNKQAVYDIIKKADFQLCLSVYDTFNVAIAESLVLGCPCITTNTSGASYLIKENFNGIVLDEKKDVTDHFKMIFNYVERMNYNERLIVESNSIEYKKRLSWKSITKMYIDLGEY